MLAYGESYFFRFSQGFEVDFEKELTSVGLGLY